MPAIRKWRLTTHALQLLITTLLLALLCALLLAGAAQARPGRPTAMTPNATSVVTTTQPTFKWGKAARASRYEVRVYRGTALQVKKTGITRLSWKSSKALPKGVRLTWKVRGRKAGVNGPWSRSRSFKVQLAIGDAYRGGKVAYILQEGDPGYVAGQTHGLIAATADQTAPESSGIQWSTEPYWWVSVPGTSTALGSGSANTDAIIALNGAGTTYAAGLARAYNGGGYGDWYLPSKDELNKLYLNRVAIGGFETMTEPYYWSSSEDPDNFMKAWSRDFIIDFWGPDHKPTTNSVRAIRSF